MKHTPRALAAYCTVALLALTIDGRAAGQAPAPRLSEGEAEFSIFIGGNPSGREQVRVARSGTDWIVTSTGSLGPAAGAATTRFEVRYSADLHPIASRMEMTQGPRSRTIETSYGLTTAVNEITQDSGTSSKTDQISARAVVLPNNFYAAYEVLAARLVPLDAGAELPAYIAPQMEIALTVQGVTPEQIEGPAGTVATRRYDIVFANPGGPMAAQVTIDDRARFLRLEIPAAGLSVVRSDLATVGTRTVPARNPTDTDVTIPAAGFNLAGTLTMPPGAGRLRHPAVVLVGGSGQVDRDQIVAGIPIFAQLAGALAEQGFMVLRYDKRGVGQSGGRTERVTLQDYAEDAVAAHRWLRARRDTDNRRIALVGHSEGGSVAMMAAARERRITGLVLISAMGTTGAELILEQQRHMLGVLKTPEDERQAKIALQRQIQEAVVSGEWEGIDEEIREQADSTWFRSLLLFDPAEVMPRIRQPILIIQPELDRQVPAYHGQRLADLAEARRRRAPVELASVPGINHLLVPAETGEVGEYGDLEERTIAPEVARRIAEFLK